MPSGTRLYSPIYSSPTGAGGVHHVAFRTPDGNDDAWAER